MTIDDRQAKAANQATTANRRQLSVVNRVAWLSLDEGDSDPTRFLTYLVAALQTIAPSIGAGVVDALHASQPPLPEAILTALLNEVTTLPDPFVLVLDDYHECAS